MLVSVVLSGVTCIVLSVLQATSLSDRCCLLVVVVYMIGDVTLALFFEHRIHSHNPLH